MNTPSFEFHSGRSAKTVADLLQILSESSDAEFSMHVTEDRNDFAQWIKLGLHEKSLAAEIRALKSREETMAALERFVHPHKQRTAILANHSRKDFFFGLGIGIIIGLLAAGVLSSLS